MLNGIFSGLYDYVFLFDHISGHAKKCTGGLDVGVMNVGYGGGKYKWRKLLIEEEDGYLGPHYDPANPNMVTVGEYQYFIFPCLYICTDDDGPFNISKRERN